MKIELAGCVWIPKRWFDRTMRDSFTLQDFPLDWKEGDDIPEIAVYREDRPGFIGLPRVRGLQMFANMEIDDRRRSHPVKYPKHVKLRDEQIPVVESAVHLCATRSDFILQAATGKGKTVMGLAIAAKLGETTLVVVDQEFLMDQWVERIEQHLGIPKKDIGIVQGKRMDYKGKRITICMAQTIARKEALPPDFVDYFGLVLCDESQTVGAPTFSRALLLFTAKNRIGLSATPNRKDVKQKIIQWNLGKVAVKLLATPEASNVYILESETVFSYQANAAKMTGRYLGEIADAGYRNLQCAEAIHWLYSSGRDVLVISDRIEQLQGLFALCGALGVPESEMRMCAKSRMVWKYEKDPTPPRRPAGLVKDAPYTPVRLAWVQKTIPKKQLDEAKAHGRVLFATYGIMAKGVDIPRISAGIDVSPRSESTQVIGRTLRPSPGKLRPIWVTIADVNSYRSLHQLSMRISDYIKSNAEVFLWHPQKGRKPLDHRHYRADLQERVDELKQCRIVTSLDGNNTLVTPR